MSNQLFEDVLDWAASRGILDHGTVEGQLEKLHEEVDELNSAIDMGDKDATIDGLGDSLVVLIILADMLGYDLMRCLQSAYNEISGRTGEMRDGVFVKDE